MSSNHLAEPRYIVITTIFFLYGIFVMFVLLFSGAAFFKDVWRLFTNSVRRRMGLDVDSGGGGVVEEVEEGTALSVEGTLYVLLSESSRKRLDTLRQSALERLLLNYSLILNKNNVVLRQKVACEMGNGEATTEGDSTSNNTASTSLDIEEGLCNSDRSTLEDQSDDAKIEICNYPDEIDDNDDSDSDESPFTHVLIPQPGVGLVEDTWPFTCKQVTAQKEFKKADTDITSRIPDSEEEAANESNRRRRRRKVPIFCPICLSEFDLQQKICWSSNSECTHVFHSDCMIQWLLALGRKHSLMKRYTSHPTERQLCDEVQCPCCRQEFIKAAFCEKRFSIGSGSSHSV